MFYNYEKNFFIVAKKIFAKKNFYNVLLHVFIETFFIVAEKKKFF